MRRDVDLIGVTIRDACRVMNAITHKQNKIRTQSLDKFDNYLTNVAICKLYEVYLENILMLDRYCWIPYRIFDIDKLRRSRNHLVHGFNKSYDSLTIGYASLTLPDQIRWLKSEFKKRKAEVN